MVITRQPNMKKKIRITESDLYDIVRRVIESKKNHVECERCDWEWDITPEDEDPYLCHMCGHRNDLQENKKMFSEQEENEPNYVEILFPEEPFRSIESSFPESLPDGPIKILNQKFTKIPFTAKDGDFEIEYKVEKIGPGRKFRGGWPESYNLPPNETQFSGWGTILKVLYKGQDVTDIVKNITRTGGKAKEIAEYDFYKRVERISKHLHLYPAKFRFEIAW
jgi:hypothetical protein